MNPFNFNSLLVPVEDLKLTYIMASTGAGVLFDIISKEEAIRLIGLTDYTPDIIESTLNRIGDILGYEQTTEEEAESIIRQLREETTK